MLARSDRFNNAAGNQVRLVRPCYAVFMFPPDRDPAATVRLAWGVFRLPALQAMVEDAIASLEGLDAEDLIGRDLDLDAVQRQSEQTAIFAAREACAQELREESGVDGAQDRRLRHAEFVRESISNNPPAWESTFRQALLTYRRAAGRALLVSLSSTAVPT